MHDTAFRIGCLVMDIYADVEEARILELGSANVNGSLRDHSMPSTHYVGIDLEAGDGVDIVVAAGELLPVEDETFDLVMASSVFEHDPAFWMTFLEMCRKVKSGGYVYINVPSNGAVHRYPEDHWRFYPDSALALVRWARSQGEQVTLIESFVARREADIWNDFVAIFRKDGVDGEPPKMFVHDAVSSCNVRTWRSAEVLRSQDLPEDMALLQRARDEQAHAAGELERLAAMVAGREQDVVRLQAERDAIADERNDIARSLYQIKADILQVPVTEVGDLHNRLTLTESTLRQREEEIAQLGAALSALQEQKLEVELLTARLADADAWVFRLAGDRRAAEQETVRAQRLLLQTQRELAHARARLQADSSMRGEAERWRRTAEQHEGELSEARQSLEEMSEALDAARGRLDERFEEIAILTSMISEREESAAPTGSQLDERFREIAMLSGFLREQEQSTKVAEENARWLRDMHLILSSCPWWWAYMPKSWQQRKRDARVQRKGQFDARAYLDRYPDVEREGMNPLQHYIRHGQAEGRQR
jgi:SAM-dependent methyltransferase